jgi:hypothetical protein
MAVVSAAIAVIAACGGKLQVADCGPGRTLCEESNVCCPEGYACGTGSNGCPLGGCCTTTKEIPADAGTSTTPPISSISPPSYDNGDPTSSSIGAGSGAPAQVHKGK